MLSISSWEYTNTNTNTNTNPPPYGRPFILGEASLSQHITGGSYLVLCPCPGLISSRCIPDDLIYTRDFCYYLCVDDC